MPPDPLHRGRDPGRDTPSPKPVRELGDRIRPEHHPQLLLCDIDGGDHVRILGRGREEETFPEDIEVLVAPDEPHEVVAARLGLGQGDPRGLRDGREAECLARPLQGGQGRLPAG